MERKVNLIQEEAQKKNFKDSKPKFFLDINLIKRVLKYCIPYKFYFLIVFVLLVLSSLCNIFVPYISKIIIDNGIVAKNHKVILLWSIIFASLVIINYIFERIHYFLSRKLSSRIITDIRKDLFEHIQNLSLSFFDSYSVGRIIARIIPDVFVFYKFVKSCIIPLFVDLLTTIGVLIVMFKMNYILTLWALLFIPTMIVLCIIFKILIRSRYRIMRKNLATMTSFVCENINGVNVVKSFAREKFNLNEFKKNNREFRIASIRATTSSLFFRSFLYFIPYFSVGISFILGAYLISKGAITIGIYIAFIQYINRFFQPIKNIASYYDLLQQAMAAAERIFDWFDIESDVKDKENAIELSNIEGIVDFNNVSFGYKNDEKNVKNISLHVPRGHTVAFVGSTGAGKSTLINLLARQYDVNYGSITIDGIDIRDIKQKSLHKNIGFVLQESIFFKNTIMENIRFGKLDATDEEIIEVTKKIGIYDFIMSLPEGFKTEIKDGSSNLSAGQKQLINIARTMISNPPILILDEATSKIDYNTEKLIQNAIKEIFKDRTSFVVAHRLSTIKDADCIYVIDDGEIVESGSHEELMKIPNGKYHELYDIQFSKLK